LAQADVKPDPGDYTALPKGTDVVVLYQQNPRGDKVYSGGKKVADNLDLDMTVGVLRLIHFTEFFNTGLTWDPQIVIPFGYQKTGATDSKNSGLGDITFGGTVWTIADLAKNEHLGWSVFVTAPTGSEKNQGFALSSNRWALDFQVGYIKGLTDKITWDVIAETEFYDEQRSTDAKKTVRCNCTTTCATTSPPTLTPRSLIVTTGARARHSTMKPWPPAAAMARSVLPLRPCWANRCRSWGS